MGKKSSKDSKDIFDELEFSSDEEELRTQDTSRSMISSGSELEERKQEDIDMAFNPLAGGTNMQFQFHFCEFIAVLGIEG